MTAALPARRSPVLEITPERPCLDTVLRISLRGLPPGTEVTLRASQADPHGRPWQSAATFAVAADGTVDLARDAPVRGSYRQADPMGLVWSMTPAGAAAARPAGALAPARLEVTATVGGTQVAAAGRDRLRVPDGLRRTEVGDHGLVGVLYTADGPPRPGVLLLGGAEGGLHEDDAALLAAHGYSVLALAYYGTPRLPATLQRIPLEYFGLAVNYLRGCHQVRAHQIAALGASKGGEAALLAASTFPGITAAVSVVGSGAITQGISQDTLAGSFLDIMSTPVACWTYQDRDLPYLPNVVTPELERLVSAGAPVPLRLAFEPALSDARLPAATISAEQINGPVLLISSTDDQGYGPAFHDIAARRLASRNHQHPWQHLLHPHAGHLIAAPPYRPATITHTPGPGITFHHGGTPQANARACAAAWQQTLRFLRTAFADRQPA
jgi:dienelactone hydrolase